MYVDTIIMKLAIILKYDVGIEISSWNRLCWCWSCEQSRKTCQLWISGTYKHFQQTVFEFKKYIINRIIAICLIYYQYLNISYLLNKLSVSCQYDFSAWKHYKEIDEHTNKRVNESPWCIHHVSFKGLTFLTLFL